MNRHIIMIDTFSFLSFHFLNFGNENDAKILANVIDIFWKFDGGCIENE